MVHQLLNATSVKTCQELSVAGLVLTPQVHLLAPGSAVKALKAAKGLVAMTLERHARKCRCNVLVWHLVVLLGSTTMPPMVRLTLPASALGMASMQLMLPLIELCLCEALDQECMLRQASCQSPSCKFPIRWCHRGGRKQCSGPSY